MTLAELRKKNKLKDSIIYAKRENEIPAEVAQKIKDDAYYGFIQPIGHKTLSNYCQNQ